MLRQLEICYTIYSEHKLTAVIYIFIHQKLSK